MRRIALIAGVILVFVSGLRSQNDPAKSEDRIIAQVNEEAIRLSDLNNQMVGVREQLAQGYSGNELDEQLKKAEKEALENLVREKLCLQKAKELGIGSDIEPKVSAQIERIRTANNFKDTNEFERALEQQGQTLPAFREYVRKQLIITALITEFVDSRIDPSSEEVEQYYKAHAKEYSIPPEVTLSEIVLPAGPADAQDATRINELRTRLVQGEPFDKLASQYSKGPTAGKGGSIGNFEMAKLPPQIAAAIEPLKNGEISQVVKTTDGYALYRLDSRNPASLRPLDTVSDDIKQLLRVQKRPSALEKYFDQLRNGAHIQYFEK